MTGKQRSAGSVIGLSIVTLGIYSLVWQYSVFKEMKEYSGEGVGGPLGLVIAIFVGIVNAFLLPSEIGKLYASRGQASPVSGNTGFFALIPLAGWFIWVMKTQNALNAFWAETGAPVGVAV